MPTAANADRKTLILTGASRGIGHATVKRFASAARFCQAHDEVQNFLRVPTLGRRPAPLRWQRQLRHHHFSMLREMMLAA